MTHVTPAAAGFQMSSRFTKYPTQNLGDSILNSLESLLSKMLSNSPPPTPNIMHATISTPFPPVCTTLAAAEVKYLRHITKYPTQNFGDSILNSLESPLSKIISSAPPPHTPNHACYHLHAISTSAYHPYCYRSQICSPFHHVPHPKTSLVAFYTHIVVYKCSPCPHSSKNMPHGTIRAHIPTVTPHCAESGSAGQTGSLNREPHAPNPEVRAPGSTPTTPACLWAPYTHLGRLEAALSPPRGAQNDPSF